jgi:hypothetical protein
MPNDKIGVPPAAECDHSLTKKDPNEKHSPTILSKIALLRLPRNEQTRLTMKRILASHAGLRSKRLNHPNISTCAPLTVGILENIKTGWKRASTYSTTDIRMRMWPARRFSAGFTYAATDNTVRVISRSRLPENLERSIVVSLIFMFVFLILKSIVIFELVAFVRLFLESAR